MAGISRKQAGDFQTREVAYEEIGLTVFRRKGELLEIRKKTGEKIELNLTELNRKTRTALPKTSPPEALDDSLWRFEPLENIFSSAMIDHKMDFLPLLRKDDLKTPLTLDPAELKRIRQKRIERILKEHHLSLPVAYIATSSPCTYQKISASTTTGSCASPGIIPVYAKPDRLAEKILDASLSEAHLEGRSLDQAKPDPSERHGELLIFEERGAWLRAKLVVLEQSKRVVWLNKKDLTHRVVPIEESRRLKTLLDFLEAPSSETDQELSKTLRLLADGPLNLDLDSATETKWHDGILWVRVHVRREPHCTGAETSPIATGWLPYIDPGTKKPLLSWFPRGC